MEKPSPCGIIFYEFDLEAVVVLHNDPMVITISVNELRISQLLVDEGSAISLLYLNY